MATKRKVDYSENPVVLTIKIRENGEIASIDCADGKQLTKPHGNLAKKLMDVNGLKLSAIYSYQFLKFVDGNKTVQGYWKPWNCDWWMVGQLPSKLNAK